MLKKNLIYIFLSLLFLLYSCTSSDAPVKTKITTSKTRLSFETIKGIKYQEVKRRFSNGLSFDSLGFQQEPSWIIQFVSNDSIRAYSPQKKAMQGFHLHYDHGDVYNFAKEWFRIKSISKDSVVMQRLFVSKKEIAKDIRSDVNLTYYAQDYIKNTLKTTAAKLQRPTAKDTTFIRGLSDQANRNPTTRDSVFAGRQPVRFIPKNKMISVEKLSSVDVLNGKTEAFDYLYPSYRMVIQKAYKDFGYTFTVLVDKKGKLYLGTFSGEIPEYHEVRKKVLEGIISVYLQNLLTIKPGTTLGIPHASEVTVTVKGIK
ncbi:hypothetical protein AAKU52_000826 [Pedobacter sp. CG_S7]|uniref:hypothetical protein n=1 Tax=Pedobacter sp. CG_S7 TaxID=3143930 RepID=UPI00339609D0